MIEERTSFTAVSGYVDGELESADAAHVAARAASDPRVADAVATLHGLKNALHMAYTADRVVIATGRQDEGRLPRMMQAACIAAVAAAMAFAGGFGLSHFVGGNDLPPMAAGAAARAEPERVWTAATLGGQKIATPDISAAGLFPDFVELAHAANGTALTHVGYVGRHGCRLSFYAADLTAHGEAVDLFPGEGLQIASWNGPDNRFFAVATGMDRSRFAIIAAALEALTTRPSPMDEQLQVALAESHHPCTS